MQATVQLGDERFVLVPQRHTYLKRRLGTLFDSLGEEDVQGAQGLMDLMTDKPYEVLKVFIPDLMPRWKFEGFATEEARQADEYNEEHDHSPTAVEIIDAIKSALEVNELSQFKALGNFISPELIRALMTQQVAEMATRGSRNSLSQNGEQTLTTSTVTNPTSA